MIAGLHPVPCHAAGLHRLKAWDVFVVVSHLRDMVGYCPAHHSQQLLQTLNPELHRENMKAFEWILERTAAPASVWAAWGAIIEKRDYLAGCVRDIAAIGNRYGARWFTAGKRSKAGHPHHPLYLPKDSALNPFDDLLPYLDALSQAR